MEVLEVGKSQKSYKSFPEHQHGCWEILLFCQGFGDIYIEGRGIPCHAGSIFILPPYTPHRTQSPNGLMDMSMFIRDFRPIGGKSLRFLQDDAQGSIAHILDMAWHFSRMDTPYSGAAVNVMGDLIYQICVCFYNQTLTRDLRLEKILELMQENVGNPEFDLSAALEKTGYHKGYFRRIFKEATGQSPVAYFHHLRMEYAKSLFHQFGSSRTVKDIAAASGFTDALYFSRIFRRLEGMSPSDYQQYCVQQSLQKDLTPVILDTPTDYWGNH